MKKNLKIVAILPHWFCYVHLLDAKIQQMKMTGIPYQNLMHQQIWLSILSQIIQLPVLSTLHSTIAAKQVLMEQLKQYLDIRQQMILHRQFMMKTLIMPLLNLEQIQEP